MSTNRKKSDARRFGFCLRCLRPVEAEVILQEHHVHGRKTLPSSVVFICEGCHQAAEGPGGPIAKETELLTKKNHLMLRSSDKTTQQEKRHDSRCESI